MLVKNAATVGAVTLTATSTFINTIQRHCGELLGTKKVKANQWRVAVYGTLKQGQCNHHILADALYVGHCQLHQITLYDIGPYPGAKLRASDGVDVEVYDVNSETFARLDELEDYNAQAPALGLYDRFQLETSFGTAWIYLYNPDVSGLEDIVRGGWPRESGRR